VAVCGQCVLSSAELQRIGITRVISLADDQTPVQEAMLRAERLIRERITAALDGFGTRSAHP
jgi:hypothetical protein